MTRPLIGITSEMAAAGWGDRVREAVVLPASYAWAVERAGCVPVVLPPVPLPATQPSGRPGAAALAARLDAVVFSDGGDIAARRCGGQPREQAPEPDLARDASEFALMRAVLDAGLPLLAIGRGMQVLNAVRGGSMIGRRRAAGGRASRAPAVAEPAGREVRISPDSRLGQVLGPSVTLPPANVPAGRHQAPGRLGAGLTAVAWSDDQAVEAVELAGHRFAVGLQWHPEEAGDMRVFEELRALTAGHTAAA